MSSDEASAVPNPTEELRQKVQELRQDLNDVGRLLRELAQQKLEDARSAAAASCRQSGQQAQECCDQVEGYVRTQPLKSLLLAGGAGLLLGMIWSRR